MVLPSLAGRVWRRTGGRPIRKKAFLFRCHGQRETLLPCSSQMVEKTLLGSGNTVLGGDSSLSEEKAFLLHSPKGWRYTRRGKRGGGSGTFSEMGRGGPTSLKSLGLKRIS